MKNFGLLKEGYIKLMLEGLANKDKSKIQIFRKFKKSLKTNPIYKKQNNMFNLLESINDVDDEFKDMYVNEAIDIVDNINEDDLLRENILLVNELMENNIDLSTIEYDEKNMHESITNYAYLPRYNKNFKFIVESKKNIMDYKPTILETKDVVVENVIPPSMIFEMMMMSIRSKYPSLTLLEARVIASNLSSDETLKENLFNEVLLEAKSTIEELMESNIDGLGDRLKETQDKLNEMVFINETYIDDMCKLIELTELKIQ